MYGVDDLGVVDPLQVDRGDTEIGVAELALDDVEPDALVCHLDRVCVTELMWSKAPAHAGLDCEPSQLGADGGRRPRPPAGLPVDDAEERPHRQLSR